jgi:hypothetical protein
MRAALKDCHLEERIFELPPVDLPHQMPAGYHGALELLTRNDFGSSFPGRYRLWNLEDARSYFKKKPF